MAMIKRAKSGKIEEMVDKETPLKNKIDLTWSDEVFIKDVLDVPVNSPSNIDVDLDADEDDEIAVKC